MGYMNCLDFHTVKAVTDATASFRHFKPALCKMTSERTFSESFVLVMVLAVALIALLISSVMLIKDLSSLFNFTGIVTGQAAKIFPITKPLANVDNTCGGKEKLSL